MRIAKKRMTRGELLILLGVLVVVVIAGVATLLSSQSTAPEKKHKSTQTSSSPRSSSPKPVKPSFDTSKYSVTDPTSLWVIVNKQHSLQPLSFTPSDLQAFRGVQISEKMQADLVAMVEAARQVNVTLRPISGYRSFSYQTNLYNSYVAKDGQAAADTYSARPGYSEHQTGLAVDIGGVHGCDVEACFGETIEGKWVAEHAAEFGFIIRYVQANEAVTGYSAEPWHLRYVGRELAEELGRQNISTLEEFFHVPGGKEYR